MTIPDFETTFAVPLSCESCIKEVTTTLYALPGIINVSASLPEQLISITGNASPSSIAHAIESTGRDAILRGSGKPESAAVCILETHCARVKQNEVVKGLVRMVQVGEMMTVCDVTLKGVREGRYWVSVRESGDISRGARSCGGVWGAVRARRREEEEEEEEEEVRGNFGIIEVGSKGIGSVFISRPVQIWEMIGRGIVVSRKMEGSLESEDEDTFVGVVARSAGVWDNDKTVCSCSGKTVWEERKEQKGKGML